MNPVVSRHADTKDGWRGANIHFFYYTVAPDLVSAVCFQSASRQLCLTVQCSVFSAHRRGRLLRHHSGVHTRGSSPPTPSIIHPPSTHGQRGKRGNWRKLKAWLGLIGRGARPRPFVGLDPHGMSPRSMQAQARLTSSLSCRSTSPLHSGLKPQSVASIRDTARAGPQGRGRWCLDETAQHWHSPRARRGRRTRRRK